MSGSLTQLLCLVYVLWTEEDQLLHGLEGSTGCWAWEVVEPWAALSMAPNGCTQPFAVFAKLKQTNGNKVRFCEASVDPYILTKYHLIQVYGQCTYPLCPWDNGLIHVLQLLILHPLHSLRPHRTPVMNPTTPCSLQIPISVKCLTKRQFYSVHCISSRWNIYHDSFLKSNYLLYTNEI